VRRQPNEVEGPRVSGVAQTSPHFYTMRPIEKSTELDLNYD
jgi:hypothetical protein